MARSVGRKKRADNQNEAGIAGRSLEEWEE